MCGIAGVAWRKNDDRLLVEEMTHRIRHRGPDDEQFLHTGRVSLGFARLSIIDPEGGRQPIFNESRDIAVLCNGEIYNHHQHRSELSRRGHEFGSHSDAEVLPHLYEEHGERFVELLDGKYAIALYDKRNQQLLLARDRLGIKPIYYADLSDGFFFGSEMKCILAAKSFHPEVDREALDWMLTFRHIPGSSTLLTGIKLLEPGHTIVLDTNGGGWKKQRYYSIPRNRVADSFSQAKSEVTRRLDDAVQKRLMSDVPLGVALSGGLDSSAVAASAALQMDKPPVTFSVYTGDHINELPFARLVADRYKTDHHEINVTPAQLDEIVPKILWHIEEPVSVSEIPTYYLGKAVSKYVKVLLCGEGSDELFGGYSRFQPIHLAAAMPSKLLSWGYVRGINGLTQSTRHKLYSQEQLRFAGPNSNAWLDAALRPKDCSTLNGLLRYELEQQLRSQVIRLDKLTMGNAVEARCPFLDPQLVGYVANLPASYKVRGFKEKVLLKAAMKDRLPREIIERRKLGMSNPVRALLNGSFRDICREEIRANAGTLGSYFSLAAVDRLFGEIGKHNGMLKLPEQQIFHIYLFSKWHRMFVDGEMPKVVEDRSMQVSVAR